MATARELGLAERLFAFEDVPDEELARFYSAADIMVQPSKLEGFGFPVLEAMACATPVVCARAGATPEIAGQAATYFDPDDPAELASAIQVLLADEALRRQQAQRGLERAAAFTWAATAAATAAVYRDLLAERAGDPLSVK